MVAALKAVPVFADLAGSDLEDLSRRGRVRRLEPGAFVFNHGDPAREAYVVLEGRVQLISSMSDGRVQLHAVVGPGEMFGELGVVAGQPRSNGAECLESVAVWAVPGVTLRRRG